MAFNKARALQEAQQLVAQGKLAQAIQQYLVITENDPRDLALLNFAGDLCVRDRNIPEALRLFRRLADAYAREGFTLKAIAIYRKITKLDPNSVEPVLKLAELYREQGLSREALGLYAEALESAERANQRDQALDIVRQIVAADPENEAHGLRLAQCLAAVGRRAEAARLYLEAAEAAERRNDHDAASALLAKARELDGSASGLARAEASPAGLPIEPTTERSVETPPVAPVPEQPPEPEAMEAALLLEPGPGPETELALELAPQPVSTHADQPLASAGFSSAPLTTPESVATDVAPAPSAPAFDLSSEWEALAASSAAATVERPPFNEQESRTEVEFYLSNGLIEEARQAVKALEEQFPGCLEVADLRRQVDEAVAEPRVLQTGLASAAPAASEMLQNLAADLESHWTGLGPAGPAPSSLAAAPAPAANPANEFSAALGALLDELNEEAGQEAPEDPETHYGLGVAFREMGLVEEAIGEFQKVVNFAPPALAGSHFLQACTLLGVCFMDRQLPALAAQWYRRALDSPAASEDTRLGLQYDLGMACEQAGDPRAALESFLEVYSRNIDYRDVAEKIRLLRERPS